MTISWRGLRRRLALPGRYAAYLAARWRWQAHYPFVARRPHILLERLGGMGDVLLATPAIREMRRRHPHARITFLTRELSEDLLSDNPFLDEVVWHRSLLKGRRFDTAINLLHEYYPEQHIADGTARAAGLTLDDHSLVLTLRPRHRRFAEEAWRRNGIGDGDLVIGVHVYATWASRRWPVDHFRAVARHFMERHGARIVQVGSEPESALGMGVNLIGRGTPRDTAGIIKRCTALVCVDSLMLHVAAAVNTPVVVICGPVLPARVMPFNNISVAVRQESLACLGCHHRQPAPVVGTECVYERVYCMEDLPPETVIAALEELLARPEVQARRERALKA